MLRGYKGRKKPVREYNPCDYVRICKGLNYRTFHFSPSGVIPSLTSNVCNLQILILLIIIIFPFLFPARCMYIYSNQKKHTRIDIILLRVRKSTHLTYAPTIPSHPSLPQPPYLRTPLPSNSAANCCPFPGTNPGLGSSFGGTPVAYCCCTNPGLCNSGTVGCVPVAGWGWGW